MCEFPLLLAFPLGGCADLSISNVELVSTSLLRIVFSVEMITNSDYYNINNYTITGTPATIKEVMPVYSTASSLASTSSYTLLRVNPLIPGQTYTIGASNLVSRYGTAVSSDTVDITVHNTKTNSALNTFPSHFDKTPGSIVFGVLAAITRSDEIIGGAFTAPMEVT